MEGTNVAISRGTEPLEIGFPNKDLWFRTEEIASAAGAYCLGDLVTRLLAAKQAPAVKVEELRHKFHLRLLFTRDGRKAFERGVEEAKLGGAHLFILKLVSEEEKRLVQEGKLQPKSFKVPTPSRSK